MRINGVKLSAGTARFAGGFCLFITMALASGAIAQTGYKSEAEMIKAATTMYDESDFTGAMPLYSQLVSLYPKDIVYNMKYGVCLFHADRDKAAGLKYLKYAVSSEECPPIGNYHYGRALHVNYDFDKALKYYRKFKEKSGGKTAPELQVDRQIEMCNNGKALLKQVFDLRVVDKKEIAANEFFRVYDLGEIGGKIIVKPDNFKSKLDLRSNDLSLIYLPTDARVIYFSGYGDNKSNGKEIFRVRKSGTDWGVPENIGNVVNTKYDEDFPFMHPDGNLYFASKGHNSMGGYDLFRSEFNESTGTWSAPENLNFAISSAFDDILFITDLGRELAYFASGRATTDGKLMVYRVQVARKPVDNAFLSGRFIVEGNAKAEAAKISIFDLESNEKVGTYYTASEDGSYDISLPKGGRSYKFVVETDENSPVHTGKVDVPVQKDLVSLKQEIRLVGSGDQQKLVIKNLFNETEPVSEEAMAAVLRQSSDLEVNATEEEVRKELAATTEAAVKTEQTSNLNLDARHEALLKDMDMVARQLDRDLGILKNQIAFGFKYSFDRAKTADGRYDEVEVLRQEVVNANDREAKSAAAEKLTAAKKSLDPIVSDAIVSYDFTRGLANEFDEKTSDAGKLKSDLASIKSRGSAADQQQKQADLDQYGPALTDIKSMQSSFDIAPRKYEELLGTAGDKLNALTERYNNSKSDMVALKDEIATLQKRIDESTSKKTREQLTAEKGSKEIDLEDVEYEFENISRNYRMQKAEVSALESDAAKIGEFISKVRSNTVPVSQLSSTDQEELGRIITFLKEQRQIDDVIGGEAEVAASEGRSENLETAQHYPAVDAQGKESQYDERYQVNLSVIELIADKARRDEETSKLYRNWAETVRSDREVKENDLAYTKDKQAQQALTEKINALKAKEQEFGRKSAEFAALAGTGVIKGGSKEEKGGSTAGKAEAAGGESVKSISSRADKVVENPAKSSAADIDKAYTRAMKEATSGKGAAAAAITAATFEAQWASDLGQVIAEKERQLATGGDGRNTASLTKEIDALKIEEEKHRRAASAEFSEVALSKMSGQSDAQTDNQYYIPFNPGDGENQDYDRKYRELVTAVENHQILTADQKNKELSLIHNYWSRTIQDDILWHEEETTKLKSQQEIQRLNNRMMELGQEKKDHIKLSNEYFEKYKQSQLYMAANMERNKAETSETEAAGGSGTYSEYAGVYRENGEEKQREIEGLKSEMEKAGSKSEKQKLSLALAMAEKEQSDNELAERELSGKGGAPMISGEADIALGGSEGSWKEESENYVFGKADLGAGLPDNSQATEPYRKALENYNKVEYLQSRQQGLMESQVVNKNAEKDALALQAEIEAAKIETYNALAEAGRIRYDANDAKIEELMAANPGLQTSNPRLWRDIKSARLIYSEAEKYRQNASEFKSNSLKFDMYDQAQYMSDYVLEEQKSIIAALEAETYKVEAAGLSAGAGMEGETARPEFRISKEERDAFLVNPVFVEYEKEGQSLDALRKERVEKEAMVLESEKELEALIQQRNSLVRKAEGSKKGEKKRLMKEAAVLDAQIAEKQKELDSQRLALTQATEQENNISSNRMRLLKAAGVEDAYKIAMLSEARKSGMDESVYVQEGPAPGTASATGASSASYEQRLDNGEFSQMDTQIPAELTGDLFITSSSASVTPYSTSKPIPVDVAIPEGLIFKVQVGAYRKPIPQDLFKGFAPLMGEKLDNGITRYTAGLFRNFDNANKAKNDIRKLGYQDAFVVAFMNGVRIAFMELRNLGDAGLNVPAEGNYADNGVPTEVLNTPSKIDDVGEVSSAIAERTTNTAEVKGVFFAVQVGVFTNTIVPEKLRILRDLNSELLPNGNIRYSVGRFNTMEEARQRREDIAATIGDAFITAYSDGVRITASEASRLKGGR